MNIRNKTAQLARNWLTAFIDPQRMRGMVNLPHYLADWRRYSQLAGSGVLQWRESYPCLADRTTYTPFDAHYFYQASWAARKLAEVSPAWHVDIGSSVTMIGVISAITPTLFVDYRPLRAELSGLTTAAGNLLQLPFASDSIISLSCLHVIEHVGLGRYGDPLDTLGSIKAAQELARVLAVGGRLLFSTPVGRERIQFNAHRIFAPETVLTMFTDLTLVDYALVDDTRAFHAHIQPSQHPGASAEYACGMFEFIKK